MRAPHTRRAWARSLTVAVAGLVMLFPTIAALATEADDPSASGSQLREEQQEATPAPAAPATTLPAESDGDSTSSAEPGAPAVEDAFEPVQPEAAEPVPADDPIEDPAIETAVADEATSDEAAELATQVVPLDEQSTVAAKNESQPSGAGGQPSEQGSVKINGVDIEERPSNKPHQGCEFTVAFYGFDPSVTPTGLVTFTAQAPTAKDVALISADPVSLSLPAGETLQGNTLVGSKAYSLGSLLAPYFMHPLQGYHVKLDVVTGDVQNTKSKVFWVWCSSEPPAPSGVLDVTKDVEGTAPADATYDFTVTGPNGYAATFTLPDQGSWQWSDTVEPGDYVVTEVGTGSADTTTVAVAGGPPVVGDDATATVATDTTTVVAFTNEYADVPPGPDDGTLAVTKSVEGELAPDNPSYEFVVTGPEGYEAQFTLPTAAGAWQWSADVPAGTYTVTESDRNGAETTTVAVAGGTAITAASTTATVAEDVTTEVAFVNRYGDVEDVTEVLPTEVPGANPSPTPKQPPPAERVLSAEELPATGLGVVPLTAGAVIAVLLGGAIVRTTKR